MRSIRARLLAYLVVAFVLSWLAVTGITWFEARHEIEELFDAQLAQSAGIVSELSLPELGAGGQHRIQLERRVYGHKYEKYIGFQVWLGESLLFRSQDTPSLPATQPLGFADLASDGVRWRVFGMQVRRADFRIYSTEDYQTRNELIVNITRGTVMPLLVAVPVLAMLFWLGIGRGLLPLTRITEQVASRDHRQLEPVDERQVPDEIRPLTNALNGLFRRLAERFDQERRFTADAAHELRTPLARIKTQAQVALRARDETQRHLALENIVRGVDHGSHLVAQMLALARLEPESAERGFEPVALLELCQQAVAEAIPLATARDVVLTLTPPAADADRWTTPGHAAGLAMLLRNLLDNAIRYTPAGGRVALSIRTTGQHLQLAVTDTGPGIPADQRQRVFDRFHRGDHHDDYGCGLGLAIVQRIAELHGARLELQDGDGGNGLRVIVSLPREAAAGTG